MKIEIKKYTKELDGNVILKDINLQMEGGNIYGLIGRNGSGKSVLLKSICGLAKINNGEILINDLKLGSDIEFSSEIGAVLDGAGFIPYLSGFKNLKLLASINNKIKDEDIKSTMKSLRLEPEDKKPYKKYSLGMKQKLALAQAMMESPGILILDEPFNAIDSESVEEIKSMLIDYKNSGALIVITSHIIDDIKSMCDKVFKIENGNLFPYEMKDYMEENKID